MYVSRNPSLFTIVTVPANEKATKSQKNFCSFLASNYDYFTSSWFLICSECTSHWLVLCVAQRHLWITNYTQIVLMLRHTQVTIAWTYNHRDMTKDLCTKDVLLVGKLPDISDAGNSHIYPDSQPYLSFLLSTTV